MSLEWYFKVDGGPVKGPVDAVQLKALASSGAIRSSDLVKKGETSSQWVKASAVKGLFTPQPQPQPQPTTPATDDEFLDDWLYGEQPQSEELASYSEDADTPEYPSPKPEPPVTSSPQVARRDFPALDLYAKVMSGLGKLMLFASGIFLILGIGASAATGAWPLLVAGLSGAVLCLFAALGCYLVAEVVQLGTYYATLLEDIRNKL